MQGYLKKKNLRSGLWTPFWVEHGMSLLLYFCSNMAIGSLNTNIWSRILDILHGDINYFTENPSMGPHLSRLRGHFSLDGSTFEAAINKHGIPQLVIRRKSGIS